MLEASERSFARIEFTLVFPPPAPAAEEASARGLLK